MPEFHHEIIVECKLVLEVLSFYILAIWVKHQTVIVNIPGLSYGQNNCGMQIISNGLKMPFFQWKTYFPQFLNLREWNNLIH